MQVQARIIIRAIISVLIGLTTISILMFVLDKDYYLGVEKHYQGNTIITPEQYVEITVKNGHHIASSKAKYIEESGLIDLEYEFYDEHDYSYLTKKDISVFGSPHISPFRDLLKVMGALILIFIIVFFSRKWLDNKLTHALWNIFHPKALTVANNTEKYAPRIEQEILIKLDKDGIYGIRSWKYKRGYLYPSMYGSHPWGSKFMKADEKPAEDNDSGIHCYRLGIYNHEQLFINEITGIVKITGEWCEHADGVIRGEECEILSIIVNESQSEIASRVSSAYGVPVFISESNCQTYLNWLGTENGIACVRQNTKMLRGGTWVPEKESSGKAKSRSVA